MQLLAPIAPPSPMLLLATELLTWLCLIACNEEAHSKVSVTRTATSTFLSPQSCADCAGTPHILPLVASFKAAHAAQCVAFVTISGPDMISAGRDGTLCRYQCRQQVPSAEEVRYSIHHLG